jgi:hypothetical protein
MPGDDELNADLAWLNRIPDLLHSDSDVRDLLAAIEWYRTILTWFVDEDFGDHIVVDIRGAAREEWAVDTRFSHMRGITYLPGEAPVWVLQAAGQNAHLWPNLGELPVASSRVVYESDLIVRVGVS